jgi:FkbM family methyltransferase
MSLFTRAVRRLLAFTPYTISKREAATPLPEATIDNVALILPYFCSRPQGASFVQIGACDGVSGDSCHDFVRRGRLKAVLVEPVERSFHSLQRLYQDVPNVTLVRAAIGYHDGFATFYKAKEENAPLDVFWARQLASFDKEHLLKHGLTDESIEEIQVPSLSLSTLASAHGLDRIDLLQIDAEGFDGEVVKMALALQNTPLCINFEHTHLNNGAREEVFAALKAHGYQWSHDTWNTLAVHQDWRVLAAI